MLRLRLVFCYVLCCRVVTGLQNTSMHYVITRLSVTVSHMTSLSTSVLWLSGVSRVVFVEFLSQHLFVVTHVVHILLVSGLLSYCIRKSTTLATIECNQNCDISKAISITYAVQSPYCANEPSPPSLLYNELGCQLSMQTTLHFYRKFS